MDVECDEQKGSVEKTSDDETTEIAVERVEGNLAPTCEENIIEEDHEKTNDEVIEKPRPQGVSHKVENATEPTRTAEHVYENGKRKIKEEKPPTKVVVRRLPPLMTKETFLDQVSPLPPYDYVYFVCGDPSYGIHSFSRAYLNFFNQEDVFTFTRTFDNYVFLDVKGQEYPAIVEFAPFQRVPKQRSKKKDTLTGTIESDPMYISFKENLLAEALENSKSGAKIMKQHYFETEISTAEEINTTPLLEFLKQRRADKARIRDERREEKKRKEAERKLKQKSKEKKIDGEEEETTKDVKVLQTKDRRDGKDKDIKCTKKKEEKEKLIKENRTREFKNRSGKSYQEERIRQAERREERKKESTSITFERKSEVQCSDGKETEAAEALESALPEEKSRSFIEKKRIYENKKKNEIDDWKVDGDGDRRIKTDRNRGERRQRERERKRREEFASRKGFDKKSSEILDKKKTRPYKSTTNEFNNESKDNASENDKNIKADESSEKKREHHELKDSNEKMKNSCKINQEINEDKDNASVSQRRKSLESGNIFSNKQQSVSHSPISKRRNSLESGSTVGTKFTLKTTHNSEERDNSKSKYLETVTKNEKKDVLKETNNNSTKKSKISSSMDTNFKEETSNKRSDNSQSEQTKDVTKNENGNNKSTDTRCKISEITNSANGNNSSRSKDPRTDRRIRNKDRPSLQIYRPGMGKFSKQRLEKEKVLGSSTEVESPSHSPSPTPKVKFPS